MVKLASRIISIIFGCVYGTGLATIIDGLCYNNHVASGDFVISRAILIVPILTTITFALLTLFPSSIVSKGSDDMFGDSGDSGKKVALFAVVGLVAMTFGISLTIYLTQHKDVEPHYTALMQPIGIFLMTLSAILFKFVRPKPDDAFF